MTTIDHRILIPAGPEAVWEYVSDITHNPDWQIDCAEVIFLTSRREGPGVRWRYSAPNGHEFVIAVTAWYNGLGYEYYFVDGVPFKENKGRIRLQEIPEGTIAQWTFTYELGGLFGGMRDTLGASRQVNATISESLKTLYQKIKQTGAASRPHEAKSLMRDAPNVDARSAYQPRHPSVVEEEKKPTAPPSRFAVEPPISEGDGQPIRTIAEPPITEEDTRKRRAAAAAPLPAEAIPADIDGEPDFLKQIVDLSRFEPPRSPSDTQPRRPVTAAEIEQPAAPAVAEPLPSAEDTEPLAVTPAPTTPAPLEEPTKPAADVREETQPDYVSPARIYERPTPPPTIAPLPTAAPLAAPEPSQPIVEPKRTPPFVEPVAAAPEPTPTPEPPTIKPLSTRPEPPLPVEAAKPAPVVSAPPIQPTVAPTPEPPRATVAPTPTPEPKIALENASIWEIFGIPRPSETQEVAAPSAAPPAPAITPTEAPSAVEPEVSQPPPVTAAVPSVADLPPRVTLPPASTRAGLRLALRRRMIYVRRP